MVCQLDTVNPLTDPDWNNRLSLHEGATIFHTANWARTLYDSYAYTPMYFVQRNGSNRPAILPMMSVRSIVTGRRGVSLPFSDFCRPLVARPEEEGDLVCAAIEHGRKAGWLYYESRGAAGAPATPVYNQFYEHTLPLHSDEAALSRQMCQNSRQNVHRAEKADVTVNFSAGLDAMLAFHRLACLTRQRQGVPPQPRRFFEYLHKHLIAQGLGSVALAMHNGHPVAGGVFLTFGKHVSFKYEASDDESRHIGANHLMIKHAFLHMAAGGYQTMSFGRTDMNHDGLRRFKLGWGATETTLNYYRYNYRQNGFIAGSGPSLEPCHALFKRLPIPVLRMIGAIVYPHIG